MTDGDPRIGYDPGHEADLPHHRWRVFVRRMVSLEAWPRYERRGLQLQGALLRSLTDDFGQWWKSI